MQLTYDELTDKLGIKHFPPKRAGFTLPPGILEYMEKPIIIKC